MDQCCLTCLRGLMSSLAAVKLFGLISALIGCLSLNLWNVKCRVNTQHTRIRGAFWVFNDSRTVVFLSVR